MTLPTVTPEDIFKRLISTLAPWFGNRQYEDGSVVDTLLEAYIVTAYIIISQLGFCSNQIYINVDTDDPTPTDSQQITLFATDYFYNKLPQLLHETDDSYRRRIKVNLLAERCTRQAMIDRLTDLTGFTPIIFEPWYSLDCGGYGGADSTDYSMGYSTHGAYGSGSYPYQCFIDVTLPADQSMGNYPVYLGESSMSPYPGIGAYFGESQGPPWEGIMGYGGDSLIDELITPEQVYNTINITKVFGTVCWVRIHYEPRSN